MKTPNTYRLAPLPADAAIPEGRQHSGFVYRLPNRRIQLLLGADGQVKVFMRRLLTKEQAAEWPRSGNQHVVGRIAYTSFGLSVDAVCAFAHFASQLEQTGPQQAFPVTPVHGKRA